MVPMGRLADGPERSAALASSKESEVQSPGGSMRAWRRQEKVLGDQAALEKHNNLDFPYFDSMSRLRACCLE